MRLEIESEIKHKFPDLTVIICILKNLTVTKKHAQLEEFKTEIIKIVNQNYNLEALKDLQIFKAYRKFFWQIGIDPTKVRPSGEALIRRVLQGKPLPTINTLVDAYNLASMKTGIAIGVFDSAKFSTTVLKMRFASKDELFYGIGMADAKSLAGIEIVIVDGDRIIAIYPYRDADYTKVTESTKEAIALICGVPGIDKKTLIDCAHITIDYITRFCGGSGNIVQAV
jgi:DNA/RNA-binding domain of Phe-tRNA-synthetase-like protein